MPKTMNDLHLKKRSARKIAMLTCYDYPTALLQDRAGLDVIFVGDSLGTNELGYEREISVTLDDMIHHLKAVRRAVREAYLLADMPYRTYETPEDALATARMLLAHGADGVKLEGMRADIVSHLHGNGIEVWGHLGLNPQIHEKAAVQGKTFDAAKMLAEGALSLQAAGACMLVLELVPEELGRVVAERLDIPVIGIGAGRFTDGQVLIVQDMLGITPRAMRHAKSYADLGDRMLEAFRQYIVEVEADQFPQSANVRSMNEAERERLMKWHAAKNG